MSKQQPITFPIQLRGLSSLRPAAGVYPFSPSLQNVRKLRSGSIAKRLGFTTYNSTAMPATTRAITGIAQFNRRDTTTRYTIVGTQEKLFVAPTSGAWTELANTLGAGVNDYWDFTVFNNEIIAVNGASTPQISDGTASGTGALSAAVWRTKTSSSDISKRTGAGVAFGGRFYQPGGKGVSIPGESASNTEIYSLASDSWLRRTRITLARWEYSGFGVYGAVYIIGGQDSTAFGIDLGESLEKYVPYTDAWSNKTSSALEVIGGPGPNLAVLSSGYATDQTTLQRYFPTGDAWVTRTSVAESHFRGAGWATGNLIYAASGQDGTPPTALAKEYNPLTDTWTALTNITNARNYCVGADGDSNGSGYVVGGSAAGAGGSTTLQSYSRDDEAWIQEAAIPATRTAVSAGSTHGAIIVNGGATAVTGTALATTQVFTVSPSAPVAYFVESHRGHVLLARTSSAPSRLFYSRTGYARTWPTENYIDINADDGDWITGMFVYRDRFYVSKTDRMFEVTWTTLNADPFIGDQQYYPLSDVPGAVSNRSIVVTDHGVFYLAEDGFRVFDGSSSRKIGEEIQPTLDGYVASRMKYTAGVWVKSHDEVWFSVTSTASTHDTILVYNYRFGDWFVFDGIDAESIADVEDANDVSQILFGTGLASDGKLYTGNTGNTDNTAAIDAYYQSGWFSPATALGEFAPRELFLWFTRSGNWSVTVQTRALYATTVRTTDDVNLLSAAYPDKYFHDATDQRARILLGSESNGHTQSVRISNANASQYFELHAAIITGSPGTVGGYPHGQAA